MQAGHKNFNCTRKGSSGYFILATKTHDPSLWACRGTNQLMYYPEKGMKILVRTLKMKKWKFQRVMDMGSCNMQGIVGMENLMCKMTNMCYQY